MEDARVRFIDGDGGSTSVKVFYPPEIYWTNSQTYDERVQNTFGKEIAKLNLERVLEIGSSRGETTKDILTLFPNSRVYGLEINPYIVDLARLNCPDGEFQVGDGFKPQEYFPLEFFDGVFLMNNLIYRTQMMKSKDLLDEILFNISSVVSIGGFIFFGCGVDSFSNLIIQKQENSYKMISELEPELPYIQSLKRVFDID